jgi:replicative DNA helicase
MNRAPSEILDRLPPQSLDDERQALGSILHDQRVLDDVARLVEPEDFYADAHQRVFRAMLAIQAERLPIDIALLRDRLIRSAEIEAIGGQAYLGEILQCVPYAANAKYYAGIVARHAKKRKLIHAATEMLRTAHDPGQEPEEIIAAAERAIGAIKTGSYQTDPVSLADATVAAMEFVDEVTTARKGGGIKTGLEMLDFETGGVYGGEMTILAARAGQGKTTLALQIAYNMAAAGIPVYYASLEMNRVQVALKNLCRIAGVPIKLVRSGRIFTRGRERLIDASDKCTVPLFIHDWPKIRPFDIARAARKVNAGVVFVDYLQRVKPTDSGQKRWEQVGQISDDLKTVAADLNVPLVALAQLNREMDKERRETRPKLSHLRESGNLEQDADQVWLLWRPENGIDGTGQYAGDKWGAELKIAKHRFGNARPIRLKCDGTATAFECIDEPPDETEATQYAEFEEYAKSQKF